MKIHYVEVQIEVELEDDENPVSYVVDMLNRSESVTSYEIIDVETKWV